MPRLKRPEAPMSRGKAKKKRPGWQERKRRQERADDKLLDDVASDTAAGFTCLHELANECSGECAQALETLETELRFNEVALEMWSGREGLAADLAAALASLKAERLRHQEALTALLARFEAIVAHERHEHLDPVEHWKQFVHDRLFGNPSQS